jgi:amidase
MRQPSLTKLREHQKAGRHRSAWQIPRRLPASVPEWVEKVSRWSGLDFYRSQGIRTEIFNVLQNVLGNFDLLVTPTAACPPVNNADDRNTAGPSAINGVEIDPLVGWAMTYFINLSGHPAASVPARLSNGLPIGMQIIGRRNADVDVLAASATFERLRPWHENYRISRERPLKV